MSRRITVCLDQGIGLAVIEKDDNGEYCVYAYPLHGYEYPEETMTGLPLVITREGVVAPVSPPNVIGMFNINQYGYSYHEDITSYWQDAMDAKLEKNEGMK